MSTRPTKPNMPEITKTTLPLLTTVLAGFAVLIITSLFVESKSNPSSPWPPPNQGLFWGLTILAVSVPLFLTSTIFAIWGQAYNYQYLTEDVRKVLRIELADCALNNYLQTLEDKWQIWHISAVLTFTLGTVAFVLGTAILLSTYIGQLALYIFLSTIGVAVIWWIVLKVKEGNIDKKRPKRTELTNQGTTESNNVEPPKSVSKEAASSSETNSTSPGRSRSN